MQYTLGELLHIGVVIGDAAPEEHAHLVLVVGAAQGIHDGSCRLTTCTVIGVVAFVPVGLGIECLHGGQLHGAVHTAIDIALYLEYPADEGGVGGYHADAPSGHVVALAHGVELDAALLGSLHGEDAQGMVVEDEAVGIVVDDDDTLAAGKVDQALIQLGRGIGTGGHVGIVGPHELHTAEVHTLQLLEVGHPSILLLEVVVHHLGTEQTAQRGVGGVARIRHEHLFARVHESQRHVQYTLLGANEWLYLALGVELHAVPTLIKS